MAKKVEKLKKLYAQNGGSLEDVAHIKRTGDMIDALAELEIGGGGNNDFVVNYTMGESGLVADKTFAEISAAYESNKIVRANASGNVLYCFSCDQKAMFYNISFATGVMQVMAIEHNNENTISFSQGSFNADE